MKHTPQDIQCVNESIAAYRKQMNIRAANVISLDRQHWITSHQRPEECASQQAIVIYLSAIAEHIQDMFFTLSQIEDTYNEEMIVRLSDKIINAPSNGLNDGADVMEDTIDRVDDALATIVANQRKD